MSAVKPTIKRRESTKIYVGNVPIGGDAPIAIQSMTNTRTTDVEATVAQIKSLERVGADIVRVSVPTMDAAEAFKIIKQQVNVPLVADIHFDYRIALKVAEYGVDCLRINPGNIGREDRIRAVVDCARDKNIPIRIGVNAGSLEKDIQEKGYKDLSAILDDIPSINVGKTGWGDIDIRGQGEGSSAKNLQVLVDGAPITTLVNHPLQTNYNIVPVENIERIEVIPGGGSIIYGSGTAGGVINITTNLKRLSKPINSAEVSIGTKGEKYSLAFGHKLTDKITLQLSYLRDNKDLYFKDTYRSFNDKAVIPCNLICSNAKSCISLIMVNLSL